MHQHVRHSRFALLDRAFYAVRDFVALVHRHIAVDSNVKIDIKVEAHFARSTFLNLNDPGN